MSKNVFRVVAGMALFAGGCNLAPKYTRPEAPVPAEWPASAATQPTTHASEARLLSWQEFFVDEKLQRIIAAALQNNRDLRLAALNVQRAEGLYGIQRAELMPTVSASGSLVRQRVPGDLSPNGKATTSSQYSVNLGTVAWEIDFFGRIRNLSDAALQEYLGTEQARRSVQVLLVSGVAEAYLTLAADRENLRLAKNTLQAQQGMYDLVKWRLDRGFVPEVDLYRAQTQVERARGDVARFTQLVAQDENALELLVGASVPSDLLPAGLSEIRPFQEISAGV
ncbi:MAG: TolC family protein, partial [Bacillota bacterium]